MYDRSCEAEDCRAIAQPVFAVACLSDPFPKGQLAVTGGVFGFGEVSELFLWNSQQQARTLVTA